MHNPQVLFVKFSPFLLSKWCSWLLQQSHRYVCSSLQREWWVTGKEQQEEWRKMKDIDHWRKTLLFSSPRPNFFGLPCPENCCIPLGHSDEATRWCPSLPSPSSLQPEVLYPVIVSLWRMGATREDEGSGKEAKRRRAPRNLVLNFLRRLPHSSIVCNRLASHLHIGGLDMRYESWKFAQNDSRFWEGCNLFSRLFWVHCEPGVDDAK